MKVVFKKRRYYKGKLHEIGQLVDMDAKHARAFIRVKAAVPAITALPASKPVTAEGNGTVRVRRRRNSVNKAASEE